MCFFDFAGSLQAAAKNASSIAGERRAIMWRNKMAPQRILPVAAATGITKLSCAGLRVAEWRGLSKRGMRGLRWGAPVWYFQAVGSVGLPTLPVFRLGSAAKLNAALVLSVGSLKGFHLPLQARQLKAVAFVATDEESSRPKQNNSYSGRNGIVTCFFILNA